MRRVGGIVWIALIAGCTGGTHSPGAPIPAPGPSTGVSSTRPATNSWSFSYQPDSISYVISRTSLVTSVGDPSKTATINGHAYETLTFGALPDSAFAVTIHADTLVSTSQGTPPKVSVDSTAVHVRLKTQGFSQLEILESPSVCSSTHSTLTADLMNLLPTMPSLLTTGMTWKDSVRVNACQNDVPIAVDILRTFRVVGQAGGDERPLILVERIDSISTHGSGVMEQHQYSLNGSGQGHTNIYIDADRNQITRIETNSTVTLTAKSIEGSANFRQVLEQRFELVR